MHQKGKSRQGFHYLPTAPPRAFNPAKTFVAAPIPNVPEPEVEDGRAATTTDDGDVATRQQHAAAAADVTVIPLMTPRKSGSSACKPVQCQWTGVSLCGR